MPVFNEMEAALTGFASFSAVTILWVMMVTVCLTLSSIHSMVWLKERRATDSIMFAMLSLSTAFIIGMELVLMRAPTAEVYATVLRWYHLAVWFTFAAAIGFFHFYLQAGRPWLAWSAFAVRSIALALNFLVPENLNFKELTALQPLEFLGDVVATPVGTLNPLMAVGKLSLYMLIVYGLDASVRCWRQGLKRRAIMAGGSMVFFIILGSVQIMLAYANIIAMPLIAGIFFLGIVAVMAYELSRDILRAMQLNLDLERERAISQAVFDGVPGMIYLYSPEGRLLRWNKRVVEESGYTDEELSRLSAVDWLAGDDVNALHAKWEAAMNREAVRFEANLVLKGGRQVPYLLTGIQVQIDDKPHLVGMGLDISRQRQMERELQLQQREVARMNRIATLGALSASIAHELNQPLSVVMSNAEAGKRYLGMENPDLAELRAIMADIINAGTRAGDVVRGLRALMESGEAKVELVDLNEVIESVTQLVRAESETRRVEIVKILDTALPPTRGERVQFQQVLLNLLMNAMEGLEKMPFSRRISIRTECAENKNIRMTVQDNGPGISATGMVDIFKPFFTNKRNGTGLGLPICKLIMQLHGGSIRARDAVGGGAVFEVEFPVRQL